MSRIYFPNPSEEAALEAEARARSARYNIPYERAFDEAWENFQHAKADEDDERYDREEGGCE